VQLNALFALLLAAHAPLVPQLRLDQEAAALTIAQATEMPATSPPEQTEQAVSAPMDMSVPRQPVYTKWWFWTAIGVVGGGITTLLVLTHKYPGHDFGPFHVHPAQ
jgi:hypothetical protein